MLKRLNSTLTSWPFILCLATLLLNDWWLKAAYPGWVSGKLSDFAGVAIVALLFLAAYPHRKHTIYFAISITFLWWKSSASDTFIQFFNDLGLFRIRRTVDFTDLIALLVLPICELTVVKIECFVIPWPNVQRLLVYPVAAIALVALMASSTGLRRQDYSVHSIATLEVQQREKIADVIKIVAAKQGLVCGECDKPLETAYFSGDGLYLKYTFQNNHTIMFQTQALGSGIFFTTSASEKLNALLNSLKFELGHRFRGLEYVEPLR
jgi:hypothetical protein